MQPIKFAFWRWFGEQCGSNRPLTSPGSCINSAYGNEELAANVEFVHHEKPDGAHGICITVRTPHPKRLGSVVLTAVLTLSFMIQVKTTRPMPKGGEFLANYVYEGAQDGGQSGRIHGLCYAFMCMLYVYMCMCTHVLVLHQMCHGGHPA